jgi:pyruvate/2-oxoglutarate dehydrogenase complex dihydrolipoamide dehydrogenase (E3) component
MSAVLEPDLCIIGAGPGGLSLAFGAAACGLSAVLVEKGALGGRRLTDSIPRHAILAASRAAAFASRVSDFGIGAAEPEIDFARVRQHASAVLAAVAPNYAPARLEAMNIKLVRAAGRFTGPGSCEAGGEIIKARHFVIAAGSVERSLPIPGLELVRPLDCASLCAMEELPQRLIVIGADPDGLALAQALRRFGSDVLVLASGKTLLSEDEELAAPVLAAFARDGLTVRSSVRISRMEPHGKGVRVFIAGAGHEIPVTGSHVLIAAGRAPAIEGLGLRAAGVRYGDSGIEANARLRTSNRRIFAIGAAAQGARGDGAAERDAFLVLRTILGLPAAQRTGRADARVIWTCPAIAEAGLSEAQARKAHRHIRVLRWPFAETERASLEHCLTGHVKIITTQAGTILGAAIAGSEAEELINLFTLAISKGMTIGDIASILVPYPSLAAAARSAVLPLSGQAPLEGLWTGVIRSVEQKMLDLRELGWTAAAKARQALSGEK